MLIWSFDTLDYTYGNLYNNRARLVGNTHQSNASITIDQLTMDDNGTYECSVLLKSDLQGSPKSRIRLLVLGEGRPRAGQGEPQQRPRGKRQPPNSCGKALGASGGARERAWPTPPRHGRAGVWGDKLA